MHMLIINAMNYSARCPGHFQVGRDDRSSVSVKNNRRRDPIKSGRERDEEDISGESGTTWPRVFLLEVLSLAGLYTSLIWPI